MSKSLVVKNDIAANPTKQHASSRTLLLLPPIPESAAQPLYPKPNIPSQWAHCND